MLLVGSDNGRAGGQKQQLFGIFKRLWNTSLIPAGKKS
jgi:hypothetical protein